jgi:hypothetical protein
MRNIKLNNAVLAVLLFIATYSSAQQVKLKEVTPDNYLIPNSIFKHVDHPKNQSGGLISYDAIWFTNNRLGETLVFELGTDDVHLAVYHFMNKDIPNELIEELSLDNEEGNYASDKLRKDNLPGLIDSAKRISSKYFTSCHGYKIGDGKQLALDLYGKPDSIKHSSDYEIYSWYFMGDQELEYKKNTEPSKPIVKDSWGYSVKMFFRNDRLIAMVFLNSIP